MKIGLVIYGSLDIISGGYLYDRKLVEYLRQQGDEVEIISLPWRNYATHLTHNLYTSTLNHLSTSRFDILLQDELNHPSLFLLNGFIKRQYPIISIVHHLRIDEKHAAWQNFFYKQIERAYLESVDGFIFNGATTKKSVEKLIGPSKHIVAHPSGNRFNSSVTPEHIRQRAAQTPFKILFVGNLIRRKGLHTLLDALEKVNGDWQLAAVGNLNVERGYTESLQKRITSRVKLLGALNDEHLAQLFSSSQVLVVPSSYEGFGIVYLEGMGFGLPAIATTSGGASEIVAQGKNGFLIERDDSGSLARHLQSLIDNRNLLTEMSLNAVERFKHYPTWSESMAKIRNFLMEIKNR